MSVLMKALATAMIILLASGFVCVMSCDITDDESKLKMAGGSLLMAGFAELIVFLVVAIWGAS